MTEKREDLKTEIMLWLDSRALAGDYWKSVYDISVRFKVAHSTAKKAVFEMITEGLVDARDGDNESQMILVSVPKSLRKRYNGYEHNRRGGVT